MKQIILLILFMFGVWAQENVVPYVQTNKHAGSSSDFSSFVLNGDALLFEENEHLHLWNFKNFSLNQCLVKNDLKNYYTDLVGSRWVNTLTANSNTMYLSLNGRVERWDIKSWKKIDEFKTPISNSYKEHENFRVLTVDDKANKLLAGSDTRNIYLYDLLNMTLIKTFKGSDHGRLEHDPLPEHPNFTGHAGHIYGISKIINDRYFFSVSYSHLDSSLRKWDILSGENIATINNIDFSDAIWVSRNGKYILLRGSSSVLSLYDVLDFKPIQIFSTQTTNILSFIIDEERNILYASVPKEKLIIEYDIKTGQEIRRNTMPQPSGFLMFSPNKKYIAGQLGNKLTFWNLPDYKEILTFYPINNCDWVAITPEGYFNASEDAIGSIRIKDANGTDRALTPREIKKYKQPKKIQAILNDIISN